jgi:hypothetical protein
VTSPVTDHHTLTLTRQQRVDKRPSSTRTTPGLISSMRVFFYYFLLLFFYLLLGFTQDYCQDIRYRNDPITTRHTHLPRHRVTNHPRHSPQRHSPVNHEPRLPRHLPTTPPRWHTTTTTGGFGSSPISKGSTGSRWGSSGDRARAICKFFFILSRFINTNYHL